MNKGADRCVTHPEGREAHPESHRGKVLFAETLVDVWERVWQRGELEEASGACPA